MTDRDIDRIIADRFRRWGRLLFRDRATPLIVLGLKQPGPDRDGYELVVTTCEGTTDAQVEEMLVAALALIRAGKAVPGDSR